MEEVNVGDELQWVNIQDPIKQMITSITKAVRTQSAGIRDLDRKIGYLASTESTQAAIESTFLKCFTKHDAALLVENVNKKADQETVSTLEMNLIQVTRQLSRLNEVIQEQNTAIRELNGRVTHVYDEIEAARNPNYEQIFTYIDKQINKVVIDVNEKLSQKAEIKEVERFVPQKVDDTYRIVRNELNNLSKDLSRTISKDEFHQHLATKADQNEIRNLFADVANCVSKQDMQSTLQHNLRPIISSISSLEKVIQIQEDRLEKSSTILLNNNNNNNNNGNGGKSSQWTYDKIQNVVEDTIIQRYPQINEAITSMKFESSLIQQRDYLLNEINKQNDEVRKEVELSEREFLVSIKKKYEEKFQELFGGIRETRDLSIHNQSSIKDLASNVAKVISKKVDRGDIPRLFREYSEGTLQIDFDSSNPATNSSTRKLGSHSRNNSISPKRNDNRSNSRRSVSPSSSSIFSKSSSKNNLQLKSSYRNERNGGNNNNHAENDSHYHEDDSGSNDDDGDGTEGNSSDFNQRGLNLNKKKFTSSTITTKNISNAQLTSMQNTIKVISNEVNQLKKQYNDIQQQIERNQIEFHHFKQEVTSEVQLNSRRKSNVNQGDSRDVNSYISPSNTMYTDWRISLGEVSLNLRRELSEKCGREEMRNAIGSELNVIEKKIHDITEEMSKKGNIQELSQLENAIVDLRSKVTGELTGGRWLWTNGKIGKDGWISWDTEVHNAAPGVLIWRKGSTSIITRIPGLYRICGAVFTSLPSALQICLNGEPILSLQPDISDPTTASNSQALREERYVIRRLRHSVGEVTCLSIDEYVSLPADGQLTMRFHSASPAQAFFSVKKL